MYQKFIASVCSSDYRPIYSKAEFVSILPSILKQREHVNSWSSQKNADLICLRYGLTDREPYTYQALGSHFGISHELARRKVDQLIKVLTSTSTKKEWLKRKGLV